MTATIMGPYQRRLTTAKLGILLFITAEIMFFAGLISSFVVFRFSPVQWPPLGQPRLPLEVTAVNTLILLASGLTFQLAYRAWKRAQSGAFKVLLTVTAVLGSIFLLVQGFEWVRLLKFGLTLHASIFGGFFYCLVGTHGLHVLGGLVVLVWVLKKAWEGAYDSNEALGVEVCRIYWFFVVALWPVLFFLVYL